MFITLLKNVLWAPIKAKYQECIIKNELIEYQKVFRESFPSLTEETISDTNFVKRLLYDRLEAEKISILNNKKKGELNIIYLSPFDNWEKVNIPSALEKFGSVHYFDMGIYKQIISKQKYPKNWSDLRKKLNTEIIDFIDKLNRDRKVDVVISYLSGKHILPETIQKINNLGIITTAFWLDSDLKFKSTFDGEVYSGAASVCSAYHLNLCSDSKNIVKYFVEKGLAVFWPEGANPDHFKPLEFEEKKYDVSFIGAKYGLRSQYIHYLRKHGINVATFGFGWGGGNITGDEMIKIYSQSKINLGFGGIGYSMSATHLKGRDFEVPMCGAVYLTTHDEDLELLYEIDHHIFTHKSKKEMLKKVKYLLNNEEKCIHLRKEIRKYCLENHTWELRFNQLFILLGIKLHNI